MERAIHPGVRVRFWQKTYLLTLALFCAALLGAVLLIVSISWQQAFDAECGRFLAQQHTIAASLVSDMAAVNERRPEAVDRLVQNYAAQYAGRQIYIQVTQGDTVLGNTLPEPDTPLPALPGEGQRVHSVHSAGQERYLYVSARLPGPPDDMALVCAFSVEPFFAQWERLRLTLLLACSGIFLVLATALYVLLRGLSRPLVRLADVAGRLAAGEYDARSGEHTGDELGLLSDALNNMAAHVQENMAQLRQTALQKQQLVDNMAHELRTPLTAVGGYAEYIQRASLSEKERYEAAQYIIDEAHRLADMSQRLLQIASLRGEQAAREPVDVPALLEKTARTLSARAREKSVVLLPVQSPPCVIKGEEPLLESLFVNLGDNAIKACGPGGTVALAAKAERGTVAVIVRDTGRGMDEEILRHLGEEFYRPDRARSRQQGGAGLGVALCRQIAASHRATLSYSSRPGVGTEAVVTFTT